MGHATIYCDICGEMIPQDQIDKGKAVHYQNKYYCAGCRTQHLSGVVADPDSPPIGTGVHKASSSGAMKAVGSSEAAMLRLGHIMGGASATPSKSGSGPLQKSGSGPRPSVPAGPLRTGTPARGHPSVPSPRTTRRPTEVRMDRRAPSRPTNPYAILGVIGGVLLVALVGYLFHRSEQNRLRLEEVRKKRAAEAALSQIREFQQQNPLAREELVTLFGELDRDLQGDKDCAAEARKIRESAEVAPRASDPSPGNAATGATGSEPADSSRALRD